MLKFKVTTVGASAGFILPKEAMARLKLKKGDLVYLTEAPGGYRLTPYDPDFAPITSPAPAHASRSASSWAASP